MPRVDGFCRVYGAYVLTAVKAAGTLLRTNELALGNDSRGPLTDSSLPGNLLLTL
jgi:hypothetical protein